MTPDLWTTTSLPLKRSAPHLISPLCSGIVLRKGNRKHNLGTSSIFHEFSFRPEPPLTLVDRSSSCHIFTTWGYSCYLSGLPLTQALSQAAEERARTSVPLLLQTQGEWCSNCNPICPSYTFALSVSLENCILTPLVTGVWVRICNSVF